MRILRTHCFSLLLAFSILQANASLPAQIEHTVPSIYTNTWGGNNGTGAVFGGTKGIMQGLYIAPIPANARIFGVGFRRTAGTTDYGSLKIDLDLLLSSTTATLSSLSSTFATNLGKDATVVFPRKVVDVAARPANSSPNDWIMLPLATPWVFSGPNLIVQVKKYAASWSSTGWRDDRCFEYTSSGSAISFGKGCGSAGLSSSSTGSYLPGSTANMTLSSAPANTGTVMFLGADMANFGPFKLPLDLGPLGMKGCFLNVQPFLAVAVPANSSGAVTVPIPIPNDNRLSGTSFGTQFFYIDKNAGNTLGASTTNGRLVHIGPIICQNKYVYDLFDETKTSGTLQAGGPIIVIRSVP